MARLRRPPLDVTVHVTPAATPRTLARRRDPNSLVGAAALLTGPMPSKVKLDVKGWQSLAWDYYDTIGELRFGVGWLANALSRVNLVAATPPLTQGDEPTVIDVSDLPSGQRAVDLVAQIAGGVSGQGQLLASCSRQLTVPGVGFILAPRAEDGTDTFGTWRVLSNDEVRRQPGSPVVEVTDAETGDFTLLGPDDLLIKVWRAHPRRSHEPDSPVRAVLDSLNEIRMLTKRIAADARSRLLGAGVLVLPDTVEFPPGQAEQSGDGNGPDEFIETFVRIGEMAIQDQDSAAAKVPLVITVPESAADKWTHIKFWSEFDANLDPLRVAAIKRLALGLDMPPEVLLGHGDTNHWTAWQIAEEAITLHVEPLAELVCHALTKFFLAPALGAEGADPLSAIVWYDTSDLRTRPDLSAAASEAHQRIKLSDEAYLRELGLDVSDAPSIEEKRERILLDVAKGAPTMAPAMLAAAGILAPEVADAAAEAEAGVQPEGGSPESNGGPGTATPGPPERQAEPPTGQAPSEREAAQTRALLAACDGLVWRALERSGQRLRQAAGKGKAGGAESVPCPDPAMLHCAVAATEHASLAHLLAGAWDRVPLVAARYGVDPSSLRECLDTYTCALIASGHAHDFDKLAAALGADDAGRLVAAH